MHCLVSLVLWMLLSFLMSPLWIFCWVLKIELLPCLVETVISMLEFLGLPSTWGRAELLRTQIGVGLFLLTFVLFVLLLCYRVPWGFLFCLFLWWFFVYILDCLIIVSFGIRVPWIMFWFFLELVSLKETEKKVLS